MLPGLQVHPELVLLVLVNALVELVQLLLLPHPDLLLGLLVRDLAAPLPGGSQGAAGSGTILKQEDSVAGKLYAGAVQ